MAARSKLEWMMLVLLVLTAALVLLQIGWWIYRGLDLPELRPSGLALITLVWSQFISAKTQRRQRPRWTGDLVILFVLGLLACIVSGTYWIEGNSLDKVLSALFAVSAMCGVASGFLLRRRHRSVRQPPIP